MDTGKSQIYFASPKTFYLNFYFLVQRYSFTYLSTNFVKKSDLILNVSVFNVQRYNKFQGLK